MTRQLVLLAVFARIVVLAIAVAASYLPPFDSSAQIVIPSESVLSTTARWDAIHFLQIAQKGYAYEHNYAFLPGIAAVLRLGGSLSTPLSALSALTAHYLLSTIITCDAVQTLYHLTLHHTNNHQIAFLAAALSLIPPSPATLYLASYTEPWFTWASYRGMLYCARQNWLKASFALLIAGFFRSNAVLLGGFILWGTLVKPLLSKQKIPPSKLIISPILSLIPALPFLLHQLHGYRAFCITEIPRPWCSNRLPLIYTFVQREYWDSGLFRYWQLQQLPNFLLAAPVLILLYWGSISFISKVGIPVFQNAYRGYVPPSGRGVPKKQQPLPPNSDPFLSPSLLPHAIHAFILTSTIFVGAHVQIILRLAPSMPFVYWSAARLFLEGHSKWAKAWVMWCVVWGGLSIVLWVVFLPPA